MNNHHAAITYVKKLAQRLDQRFQDPHLSEQYAWWTVETITQTSRTQLLAQTTFELSVEQQERVEQWVHALIDLHEPIQYLIGWVPFLDLTITVRPPVLIPRPETEQWCAQFIEQLRTHKNLPLQILDLCSGSGCIGLALAHALPNAKIIAVDNALHSLELGVHNAATNNIQNITFIESDLFASLQTMQFDIIVSNPPYIAEKEFALLDASVAQWEDKHALVAARNGYDLIEKIITQAPHYIRSNDALQQDNIPQLILEHGATQAHNIVDLMRKAGYTHMQTHKDLAGRDRVVSGRIPDEDHTKKE